MRLAARIASVRLEPDAAAAFVGGLRAVAGCDGVVADGESRLVERLAAELPGVDDVFGGWGALGRVDRGAPVEIELLWGHAELFLTACIFVAVSDGEYGVDEARLISSYAHRLGMSSAQLSALESDVFGQLRARAARSR
jgi:tellurite resistance protein